MTTSSLIRKIANSLAVQITLSVTAMVILLLVLLNFLVVNQGEQIFVDVVQGANFTQFEQVPFPVATVRPLGGRFRVQFQDALFKVALIAIPTSAVIGFLVSRQIGAPLGSLRKGMQFLKQNKYELMLPETGVSELDEVTSEFNALAQELQRVESLRKQMLADTSHELKTPLTALIGQLEGIKDGLMKPDAKRIDGLIKQTYRLSEMIEGLQEFARIQGQTMLIKREDIVLQPFLAELLENFKQQLTKHKISVKLNIPKGYMLSADRALLSKIFDNLLQNAIKYSEASKITLTADETVLTFADNGIGISETERDLIFERFYRVDKSRSRKSGGLGLGLAIVKEAVVAHGWSIAAVGNQQPRGVAFRISLA